MTLRGPTLNIGLAGRQRTGVREYPTPPEKCYGAPSCGVAAMDNESPDITRLEGSRSDGLFRHARPGATKILMDIGEETA